MTLDTISLAADCMRRAVETRPNSFDPDRLNVEAVVATSTPVERRDARGRFFENLTMDALDIGRVQGVSVIDNHRLGSSRDLVGVVEDVRIEQDQLIARLRFPDVSIFR